MGAFSQRMILARAVLREDLPTIVYPMIDPVEVVAEDAVARAEGARLRGLACLLRSGAEPMDGDLDMGGHKIVNEQHGNRP